MTLCRIRVVEADGKLVRAETKFGARAGIPVIMPNCSACLQSGNNGSGTLHNDTKVRNTQGFSLIPEVRDPGILDHGGHFKEKRYPLVPGAEVLHSELTQHL